VPEEKAEMQSTLANARGESKNHQKMKDKRRIKCSIRIHVPKNFISSALS
jgi:hypothetical protein